MMSALVISERAANWVKPLVLHPCCRCRVTVRAKARAFIRMLWYSVPACIVAWCLSALRIPGAPYGTASGYWFCAGCWHRFAIVKWAERQFQAECLALCFPRFAQSIGCTQDETTSNLKYWLRFSVQASDAEVEQAYKTHNLAQEVQV